MKVLGVDPGAKHTGICVVEVDERRPVYFTCINKAPYESNSMYVKGIEKHLTKIWIDSVNNPRETVVELTAIEDFNEPTPGMGMTTTDVVTAAYVTGYLHAYSGPVVVVPPGSHGAQAASWYPKEIQRVKDGRHIRSAYDIACMGARIDQMGG